MVERNLIVKVHGEKYTQLIDNIGTEINNIYNEIDDFPPWGEHQEMYATKFTTEASYKGKN